VFCNSVSQNILVHSAIAAKIVFGGSLLGPGWLGRLWKRAWKLTIILAPVSSPKRKLEVRSRDPKQY
jgi:hypothetical protein